MRHGQHNFRISAIMVTYNSRYAICIYKPYREVIGSPAEVHHIKSFPLIPIKQTGIIRQLVNRSACNM